MPDIIFRASSLAWQTGHKSRHGTASLHVGNLAAVNGGSRGFNIAIVDGTSGKVTKTMVFDTFSSASQAKLMKRALSHLPAGRVVMIAINDAVAANGKKLHLDACSALDSIGCRPGSGSNLRFRESFAIIGLKGAAAGSAVQKCVQERAGKATISATLDQLKIRSGQEATKEKRSHAPEPGPKRATKKKLQEASMIHPQSTGVALFYDPVMAEHRNLIDQEHPEQPSRIISIMSHLEAEGLTNRCLRLPCRVAERFELETKHAAKYVEAMLQAEDFDDEQANFEGRKYDSSGDCFFLSSKSVLAARLSAGSVIEAVSQVCKGEVRSAVCVVRPPGHHAECNRPMGFCMFGNVALAAAIARKNGWAARILIIDWDVHHGNGTQKMFEDDSSVLYFSVHRHDNGSFYPGREGHHENHGVGPGEGYSVNVPWDVRGASRKGVPAPGDAEYLAAFERVLLPISAEFEPDLVIISAGFDAALGDPIGGCVVSPVGFHRLTQMAMRLAGGRLVLALEGGYNLNSIGVSMAACVRALLYDPVPPAPPAPFGQECVRFRDIPHASYSKTIDRVIEHFARFWPSLQAQALKLD